MKRLLIVSTSYNEQKSIEEVLQLHSPGSLHIETTASFAQDITFWTLQPPDALMLSLPEDDLLQGYFLTKLRKDVPKTQPIIILCSAISQPLMQLSLLYSRLRLFKTPVEGYALYRSVFDLTKKYKDGENQNHPRYLTEQPVELMSDLAEGRLAAIMKNLSLSGAYIESNSRGLLVNQGDLVKVSVYTQDVGKQYVFDARIVWVKPQKNGMTGYGVTFVNKEEVYNSLLKNL